MHLRKTAEQGRERSLRLQTGQGRSNAVVDTVSESQRVRLGTVKLQTVRILKLGRIVIRRTDHQTDTLSFS